MCIIPTVASVIQVPMGIKRIKAEAADANSKGGELQVNENR